MLKSLLLLFLGMTFLSTARAEPPLDVVVTLKPVYGLVASIMGDTGRPQLLLEGKYSPHQTSLAPSMVRQTQSADMVFWVGPSLEPYMARLLDSVKDKQRSVALEKAPGITFLPAREGGNWQAEKSEETDSDDDYDHDHHHDSIDPHFWLSIENARRISDFIAAQLSRINPEAASTYAANNERLKKSLDETRRQIDEQLAPVRQQGFYVFHDAYQYFERDYHLNVLGAITVDPDRQPGAKRIKEIRQTITAANARCLFREPQFQSRFVDTIVEGLDIRIGVLDPVGGQISAGSDSYFEIQKNMADAVAACLSR